MANKTCNSLIDVHINTIVHNKPLPIVRRFFSRIAFSNTTMNVDLQGQGNW